MEMVLDVYKHPFDPRFPVIYVWTNHKAGDCRVKKFYPCFWQPAMHDYEYRCCSMCNIFLACGPLAGKRMVNVTERKAKKNHAFFIEEVTEQYERAEKTTLVMVNLNTHP